MSDTKPKPSTISLLFGVPEVVQGQRDSNGLAALAKHRQSRSMGMQPKPPRICAAEGCQQPLVKRPDETGPKFAARLYCSRACRSATVAKGVSQRWATIAAQRPKTCDECGQRFTKKPRESWTWFNQRRRCRPDCDGTADTTDMADSDGER